MEAAADYLVATLGRPAQASPLGLSYVLGDGLGNYVPDQARILQEIGFIATGGGEPTLCPHRSFERAGPRDRIFFDPEQIRAAIVTCGGLSPGLNNVVRSAYYELHEGYGVPEVLGIRFGYLGLTPGGPPPIMLSSALVESIHRDGGSMLGSSRGNQDPAAMVEFLVRERISVLLCVGGDGTQRCAHLLAEEIRARGLKIAIVGVPKTIDNDIPLVERSFGFNTALSVAVEHITGAHNEAKGVPQGIGLVKLMGRNAGFIAAGASVASGDVNFTLVPEVPLVLDGENGFLARLRRRLAKRGHTVVVVAEGAGQDLIPAGHARYKPGTNKLGDIGLFLKDVIAERLADLQPAPSIKYFDPSYHIRSVAANTDDALLCQEFARRAVDAALAGKTDMLIGLIHDEFIHVPLPMVIGRARRLDPECDLWMNVLGCTGQEKC